MTREQRHEHPRPAKVPWTEAVLSLLREWQERAAVSQDAHYVIATRLGRYNLLFGIPVVVLATIVGTSVFATLQREVATGWQIAIGIVSVLAGVLASLQTFLRFQERAEKHRAAAELWAAIRREIDQMLALHPEYLAERSDPKAYLTNSAAAWERSPRNRRRSATRTGRGHRIDLPRGRGRRRTRINWSLARSRSPRRLDTPASLVTDSLSDRSTSCPRRHLARSRGRGPTRVSSAFRGGDWASGEEGEAPGGSDASALDGEGCGSFDPSCVHPNRGQREVKPRSDM